jgi:Tol biopolymer transport system component
MKLINSDGSGERVLNFSKGEVEFSPDGKRIFNDFGHNIGVTDIDGNNRVELTHFSSSGLEFPIEIKFDISPDGKKIAIITDETRKLSRPDNLDDFYDTFNFYIMNTDGSSLEKLYTIDGSALDDLYIYNKQRKWEGFAIQNERLPDGTIRKKIRRVNDLTGGRGTLWRCKFSPDGKYLIFQTTFGYKRGIYSLNLKNKKVTDLTNDKEKWDEFLNFTFTPNGKKIVFAAGIMPVVYYSKSKLAVTFRIVKGYFYYFLLRRNPFPIPQYICIMDIDGNNYKRIARLPNGSEIGRDFIHWEK